MTASKITQPETAEIFPLLDGLIDRWCERRALRPLRVVLHVYPLVSGLTDEWHALYDGLRDVGQDDLPEDEVKRLNRAILLTQFVLNAPR